MQYGTDGLYRVGSEQECCDLPTCCECTNCECEATVTYAGITFPADGFFRTICIDENGPFLFGFAGAAAMASVVASVFCNAATGEVTVELGNKYSTIAKINNAFPAVGDVCEDWFSSGSFESFAPYRHYVYKVCNACACPDPTVLPQRVVLNINDLPNNVACVAEHNTATRTEPTIEIDCGPCEP